MTKTVREKIDDCEYNCKIAWPSASTSNEERKQTISRINAEKEALKRTFREDLEAEHGVRGHPKAQKLFDLAWEYGHSCGLIEVVFHYEELAELLKQ